MGSLRPEDIRKLLGGYATGTLTEAEREALFAAALDNQTLFDDLMREQPLHDLLRDPAVRGDMLAAVAERPRPWIWWRPAAAAFAMAAIATIAIVLPRKKAPQAQTPPTMVATVKRIEAPPQQRAQPPSPEAEPASRVPLRTAAPKALKPFQPPPEPLATTAPALDAAAPEPPKAAPLPQGVVGGVPGGVLGGIVAPLPPRIVEVAPPEPVRNSFAPKAAQMAKVQAEATAVVAEQTARARFYGSNSVTTVRAAAVTNPAAVRPLGVRYTILRKAGDDFVEADPKNLNRSDTLALRVTANVNGFLSVAGAKPVALTALEPYTTPPLLPGANELRIVFSTTPETTAADSGAVATETRSGETYVVNSMIAPALGFTVALKRK